MQDGLFATRPARRPRMGLKEAFFISLLLHLVLLAWLHFGAPEGLLVASATPEGETALGQFERGEVPVHFTFVDVPDDQPVAENPRARLFSDKTRVARQPEPTPPDATEFGPDPHAEGNSKLRQLAQPGAPVPPPPLPPAGSSSPTGDGTELADSGRGPDDFQRGEDQVAEGSLVEESGSLEPGPSGVEGGASGSITKDRRTSFEEALERLQAGNYDFSSFENPTYMRGQNYGTLSFDTRGFDWGDYARQLYLIIRKNWYDRIPIAAYYGQKGKVFIRFVIERDGSITDLALIRPSEVAPFDRAAENAIRASHPLPPLPVDFPKEREGVTFGFYYNLPID